MRAYNPKKRIVLHKIFCDDRVYVFCEVGLRPSWGLNQKNRLTKRSVKKIDGLRVSEIKLCLLRWWGPPQTKLTKKLRSMLRQEHKNEKQKYCAKLSQKINIFQQN